MRGIHEYRRTGIESAPQEDLLLLLLEAVVNKLDDADQAMAANDLPTLNTHIYKVRGILLELRGSLDHSAAPGVTGPLRTTWTWALHHINESVRTNNRAQLGTVRAVMIHMLETWRDAVRMSRGDALVTEAK